MPSYESLIGARVVVTGGASGIGRATVALLASMSAKVLLSDLRPEAVEQAATDLGVVGEACDVRDAAACNRLIDTAVERLGGLDALVHCAGVLRTPGTRPRPLHELEDDEYDTVIGVNLRGAFLMNRAALRAMLPHKSGQIINISSTSGRQGRPLDSLYSASKAGVIALSESVAEEVRRFGIRVQVLLPDAVDTPLWEQNGPQQSAPAGALDAARIAEVIAMCLALPPDVRLDNLVISPAKPARRSPAAQRKAAEE